MYRLYCENVWQEMIRSALNSRVDGYTIYEAQGCYKGITENSLIVELFGVTHDKAVEVARAIADVTQQEEVYIIECPYILTKVHSTLGEIANHNLLTVG